VFVDRAKNHVRLTRIDSKSILTLAMLGRLRRLSSLRELIRRTKSKFIQWRSSYDFFLVLKIIRPNFDSRDIGDCIETLHELLLPTLFPYYWSMY